MTICNLIHLHTAFPVYIISCPPSTADTTTAAFAQFYEVAFHVVLIGFIALMNQYAGSLCIFSLACIIILQPQYSCGNTFPLAFKKRCEMELEKMGRLVCCYEVLILFDCFFFKYLTDTLYQLISQVFTTLANFVSSLTLPKYMRNVH